MAKYVPTTPNSVDDSYGDIVQDAMKEAADADSQTSSTDTDDEDEEGATEAGSQQQGSRGKSDDSDGADDDAGATARGKGQPSGADAGGKRGPKDLTLPDGTVIKGGSERRLYEKAQALAEERDTLRSRLQQTGQQMQELTARLQKAEGMATLGDQLQLARDEQEYALKMMQAYKRNPVETLKLLLADAQAAGYKLEGLGDGVPVAALERMVAQKLAPITQRFEQESQQQRETQEKVNTIRAFFSRFPDAQIHEGPLGVLVEQRIKNGAPANQDTLIAAYFDLREQASEQGFDWRRSLAQQLEERRAGNGTTRRNTQQRSAPVRGRNGAGTTEVMEQYGADTGWDKIVSDMLRTE